MPRKTNAQLQVEIISLQGQLIWFKGITMSLIELLKDSGNFVTEVRANLETVAVSVKSTELVLNKTLVDIAEALQDGQAKGT